MSIVDDVKQLEEGGAVWHSIDEENRKALTEALGYDWSRGRSVEEGIRILARKRDEARSADAMRSSILDNAEKMLRDEGFGGGVLNGIAGLANDRAKVRRDRDAYKENVLRLEALVATQVAAVHASLPADPMDEGAVASLFEVKDNRPMTIDSREWVTLSQLRMHVTAGMCAIIEAAAAVRWSGENPRMALAIDGVVAPASEALIAGEGYQHRMVHGWVPADDGYHTISLMGRGVMTVIDRSIKAEQKAVSELGAARGERPAWRMWRERGERQRAAKPTVPEVRIGGDPPEAKMGMVYTYSGGACMVTSDPWAWACEPLAVYAPWGGPLVWRQS